jgi:acid phosphatase
MENENETQVVGNADAPYINNVLIPNYSIAENYHSIGHPSLVDYISTIAGSDFGVDSNNYPTRSLPYENIVDILSAHNLTWKAYMESMAGYRNGSCEGPLLNSGGIYGYFTKHDPFVYFTDITNNATRCSQIVPFTQFNSDLASGNLPSFSFVTPNILDDGHTTPLNASSCAPSGSTIQCSDNWLKSFLPGIIRNPEFANTIVFVTWDESVKPKNQNVTDTNKVLLIEVSPSSKKGFEDNTTYYSHYSLLATIEKVYNIENLGRNDTTANVMGSLFANNTPP